MSRRIFHASIRGDSVLKSAAGTAVSGLGGTFVAEGMCLEVMVMMIGNEAKFQVSLASAPGQRERYTRIYSKSDF